MIDFDKGQHWNLGDDKVKMTTSSSTLDYDKSRARFANLALGEKALNSLKDSSFKFGFSDERMKTSYSSTFRPFDNLQKNLINKDNKKSNIVFNQFKSREIEKKTIYKTDFVNRDFE